MHSLIIQRRAGLPFEVLQGFCLHFSDGYREYHQYLQDLQQSETRLQMAFDALLQALPPSDRRTKLYNLRKKFFQKKQVDPGPEFQELMPAMLEFQAAKVAVETALFQLQSRWEQGLQQGCQHLQVLAQKEELQRSLLFTAQDLLRQIPVFITADSANFNKKLRHTALGLAKYVTRMAVNTTPLSRMATVDILDHSALDLTGETPLENRRFAALIPEWTSSDTIKITPNISLLDGIYDVLLKEPVFYRALKVRLNPMIAGDDSDQFIWWYFNGKEEGIQQTPVEGLAIFLVQELLENKRSLPFATLTESIAAAAETDAGNAEKYLLPFTETGFLEWELPEYGLSTSWCSKLYQFLGFLPGGSSEAVITDAAFLLQWLRTAARTIPFQPVEEALQTIKAAFAEVQVYFQKYASSVPTIPLEQLFYEDVQRTAESPYPSNLVHHLAREAQEYWKSLPNQPYAGMRAYLKEILQPGLMGLGEMGKSLADEPSGEPASSPVPLDITGFPLGISLMPFKNESGQEMAVLTGIYPGGGKLFARWLHLFPENITSDLRLFYSNFHQVRAFTWYQRFNANCHPPLHSKALEMPGGLPGKGGALTAGFRIGLDTAGAVRLLDDKGGLCFLADPGLEQINSRPRFIQAVLQAGLPRVSKSLLGAAEWQQQSNGVFYRPRSIHKNIVLHREAWRVDTDLLKDLFFKRGFDFFMEWQRLRLMHQLPARFFLKNPGETPFYIDSDSVIHILLIEKWVQKKQKYLVLEEILPVPGFFAEEMAVELD